MNGATRATIDNDQDLTNLQLSLVKIVIELAEMRFEIARMLIEPNNHLHARQNEEK